MSTRASRLALMVTATISSFAVGQHAFGQGVLIDPGTNRRLPSPVVNVDEPNRPPINDYRIREIVVNGTLDGTMADLQITQKFVNTGQQTMEVQFVFPLPYDGAVSHLTFLVDGEEYEGEILDATEARRIYESYVRQTKDPALMEWIGMGLFKTSVFPVPAGSERTVSIRYSQLCRQNLDLVEFAFPLRAARFSSQPIEQLRFDLLVKNDTPIRNLYSPSHDIQVDRTNPRRVKVTFTAQNHVPTGDFRLFHDVGEQPVGARLISYRPSSDEDGYFLLFVNPDTPESTSTKIAKRILFVVDRSGSMTGEKIEQAKEALHFVVDNLQEGDLFNILTYDSSVTAFEPELQRFDLKTHRAALDFVDSIYAGGSTNIDAALGVALEQIQDSDLPNYVVFLTDGLPTAGVQSEAKIVDRVNERNPNDARIFCFGVGHDVNSRLLDKLARATQGISNYVQPHENLEAHLSRFYRGIQTPVLTDVAIDFDLDESGSVGSHVNRIYPKESQDLFAGQQLLLLGRYRTNGDGQVVIRGRTADDTVRYHYPIELVEHSTSDRYAFVSRLWATRRVGQIIDEIDLQGKNQELIDELVQLAKKHGIVTPYTSFLADDNVTRRRTADVLREAGEAADALQESSGTRGFSQRALKAQLQRASLPAHLAQNAILDFAGGECVPLTNIRQIGAKTFYHGADGWVDADLTEEQQNSAQRIERYGDAYFRLIDQLGTRFAKYMAIEEPVIVEYEGQVYSF